MLFDFPLSLCEFPCTLSLIDMVNSLESSYSTHFHLFDPHFLSLSLLYVSPNFRLPCCRSFPWIFLSFFCICQRKRAEKNFFVFYLSFSLLFFHCPFFESASLQHSQWITVSTFSQSLSSIPLLKPSWRESSVNEIKDWFLWGTTLWSGLMIDFRESNLVYRGDPLVCWKKSRCATGHSFIEMVNFE